MTLEIDSAYCNVSNKRSAIEDIEIKVLVALESQIKMTTAENMNCKQNTSDNGISSSALNTVILNNSSLRRVKTIN